MVYHSLRRLTNLRGHVPWYGRSSGGKSSNFARGYVPHYRLYIQSKASSRPFLVRVIRTCWIFFAIFQVFFAIFQVFWQHFKIDSCMSINLVPCSINIKCISWYKHTYSMHKWHQIQIHRNSKHSTEWWTCSFFFNQRNSLVAFLFISIAKTTI